MQLTKDNLTQVDFAKSELIPAIVQDARSSRVWHSLLNLFVGM